METILKHARSGSIGDGKVFVMPVEEAYRIRTGESGEETLQAHPGAANEIAVGQRTQGTGSGSRNGNGSGRGGTPRSGGAVLRRELLALTLGGLAPSGTRSVRPGASRIV